MEIRELMTPNPECCRPNDSIQAAAQKMRDADCGALPVIEDDKAVGVVTDRDICMAMTLSDAGAPRLVRGAMSGSLLACSPDDRIESAMKTMGDHKIRRLMVLGDGQRLLGIVSMDDLVLHSRQVAETDRGPSYDEVIGTLRKIYERPVVTAAH